MQTSAAYIRFACPAFVSKNFRALSCARRAASGSHPRVLCCPANTDAAAAPSRDGPTGTHVAAAAATPPAKQQVAHAISSDTLALEGDEDDRSALERPVVVRAGDAGWTHPCVSCGACCAFFRVSFYHGEVGARGIPEDLVTPVTPFHAAFKGTTSKTNCRCVALQGSIGHFGTTCAIYESRPSVCRDFIPSFEDGMPNEHCDRARAAHGLKPLAPSDWFPYYKESNFPQAMLAWSSPDASVTTAEAQPP